MEADSALERLAALAQETRLAAFRRLVQAGPAGLAAGELSQALLVPAPTLSFHLAQLERSGLVRSRREGRSIHYSADYDAMQELLGYLLENCCQGACGTVAAPRTRRTRKGRQPL